MSNERETVTFSNLLCQASPSSGSNGHYYYIDLQYFERSSLFVLYAPPCCLNCFYHIHHYKCMSSADQDVGHVLHLRMLPK